MQKIIFDQNYYELSFLSSGKPIETLQYSKSCRERHRLEYATKINLTTN